MGFRFRKSIKFGLFKVNLSKSGIGYSYGVKGLRHTRTAKGTKRTTYSIPGTGVSYVKEKGVKSSKKKKRTAPAYDTKDIEREYINDIAAIEAYTKSKQEEQCLVNNAVVSSVGKDDNTVFTQQKDAKGVYSGDMVALAEKAVLQNTAATWLLVLCSGIALWDISYFPLVLVAIAFKIYCRTRGSVNIDSVVSSASAQMLNSTILPICDIAECAKVWRVAGITEISGVDSFMDIAGIIERIPCTMIQSAVFPFKSTTTPVVSCITTDETLFFLPDRIVIMQGRKIVELYYSDIIITVQMVEYPEDEMLPSDAQSVGQTWQHRKKSGDPDRRFKKNKKIPIYLYGQLQLTAPGLHTILLFSNPHVCGEQ